MLPVPDDNRLPPRFYLTNGPFNEFGLVRPRPIELRTVDAVEERTQREMLGDTLGVDGRFAGCDEQPAASVLHLFQRFMNTVVRTILHPAFETEAFAVQRQRMPRVFLTDEIREGLHQRWANVSPQHIVIGHRHTERLERIANRTADALKRVRQRAIEIEEDRFDVNLFAPRLP